MIRGIISARHGIIGRKDNKMSIEIKYVLGENSDIREIRCCKIVS